MKSLYDKDNRYTQTATDCADAAYTALRPIFDRLVAEGYSAREVGHLIQAAVWELELTSVLAGTTSKLTAVDE